MKISKGTGTIHSRGKTKADNTTLTWHAGWVDTNSSSRTALASSLLADLVTSSLNVTITVW